jgi:hypothetical protein
MPITVGAGMATYEVSELRQVIGGYAFGAVPLSYVQGRSFVGSGIQAAQRAKWAYRAFDCRQPSFGPLDDFDILVTAAINSRIGHKAIAGMRAIAPEVSAALAGIPLGETFWSFPAARMKSPTTGSALWWAWRAYELLKSVAGVNVAVAHKTLHHKRPEVFPLLDNPTRHCYGTYAWAEVHEELLSQQRQFAALERWFCGQAAARNGVPLTRLRLHDILLWCAVRPGEREAASAAGAELGF